MVRVGIFGGTFDPPHIAHLILAAEACDQLGLDRLLWVLTADPPHKQGQFITPLPRRLEMLQAALADNPTFELSRVDIDRLPPHYALETVQLLKEQHPQAYMVYLMGGDSLKELPTWYRPQEFLAACDAIGVMQRPGFETGLAELEAQLPGISSKVRFVAAPLLEISSSQIRKRVSQGDPYRYFLPPAVCQLIQEYHLYRF